MISFDLGEDLQLIQQSAARFAQDVLRPQGRAAEGSRQVLADLCGAYAELGLSLLELPETLGGMGLGLRAAVTVAETLAEGDAGLAMALPQPGAFGRLLLQLGTAEQQRTWLAAFAAAPATTGGAVGLSERVGAGLGLSTKAVRQGDGYLLRGQKDFVLHGGPRCDRLIVLAQLEEERDFSGAAAFVLDAKAPGLRWGTRVDLVGLEVLHGASLHLQDVHVPAAQRLGAGDLTPALDSFFAAQGLVCAAHAVGVASASYTYALKYAQERRAFGKPVAHFQSIAFLLADMLMQCEAARWSVRHAAWAKDSGDARALRLMYEARAQADEAAFFVTDNAVQILGGHGYIQDHPVEKWMRDARALALMYGSREAADSRAAADLLAAPVTADLLPLGSVQPIWT